MPAPHITLCIGTIQTKTKALQKLQQALDKLAQKQQTLESRSVRLQQEIATCARALGGNQVAELLAPDLSSDEQRIMTAVGDKIVTIHEVQKIAHASFYSTRKAVQSLIGQGKLRIVREGQYVRYRATAENQLTSIQSAERRLSLVTALSKAGHLSVDKLAKRLGQPAAVVHGDCVALARDGFLKMCGDTAKYIPPVRRAA